MLKRIDSAVDFGFVNELLSGSYCKTFGRPAKEPEMKKLPDASLLAKFRTQRMKDITLDEVMSETKDRGRFPVLPLSSAAMYDYGNGTMRIHVFKRVNNTNNFAWSTWFEASSGYWAENCTGRLTAGNYTGGAADELCAMYNYGYCNTRLHLFTLNQDGATFSCNYAWFTDDVGYNSPFAVGAIASGNFDGDVDENNVGIDEIAVMYNYGTYSNIHVFKNNSSVEWTTWHYGNGNYSQQDASYRFLAGDSNGDGMDDLMSLYAESSSSLAVYTWRSTGSVFTFDSSGWNSRTTEGYSPATTGLIKTMSYKVSSSVTKTLTYSYDKPGNISSVTGGLYDYTYEYDSLNQLTREVADGNYESEIQYYSNGNIYTKTTTLSGATTPYITKTYGYTDSSWGDLLTRYTKKVASNNAVTCSITYDTIGNPLSYRDGMTMTWQDGRRLATLTQNSVTYSYTYNPGGIRTSKSTGSLKTEFFLNGSRIFCEKRQNETLMYYYDEAGSLLALDYTAAGSTSRYYYLLNPQGDVIGLIDSAGNLVVSYSYDAWGNILSAADTNGTQITSATHIGLINPFRYRGYYYDSETGLYSLQSRYYDPEIGRFINADSQLNPNFQLGYNTYLYCNNNPVMYSDPDGHSIILACIIGGAIIGAITGGAIGASVSKIETGKVSAGSVIIGAITGGAIGALAGGALGAVGQVASTAISAGVAGSGSATVPAANAAMEKVCDSFYKFKQLFGSAGEGNEWHHIVEQCQITKSGFSPQNIYSAKNTVAVSIDAHRYISGIYSSAPYGNGIRFRDYLVGQSFDVQYEEGLKVLQEAIQLFGEIK